MHAVKSRPELPGFMQSQYRFTAAVRDPQHARAPDDVAPRRMEIYQELIYTNIEDFLSNAFPVLRKISRDEQWHSLVRDFIVEHRARTPLFPEMPREFLTYLEQGRTPRAEDFPFMLELAHYEWAELAVGISEKHIDEQGIDSNGSLLEGVPVLSPTLWLCSYRYPVHRIGPNFIPDRSGDTPTFLLIYRDRKDEVGFMALNPVSAELIQRLQQNNSLTGEQLLSAMAEAMQHPNPKIVIDGGRQIMQMLQSCDVILGTRYEGDAS